MLIVYDSLTGNVQRFINKINNKNILKVSESLIIYESCILVTYTTGFGMIPDSTQMFIRNNKDFIKGVSCSGNRNWGSNFGKAGDDISQELNIPLLLKFELSGTDEDVEIFNQEVESIVKMDRAK
jgi:protein involved in ribonucleotide reduction